MIHYAPDDHERQNSFNNTARSVRYDHESLNSRRQAAIGRGFDHHQREGPHDGSKPADRGSRRRFWQSHRGARNHERDQEARGREHARD